MSVRCKTSPSRWRQKTAKPAPPREHNDYSPSSCHKESYTGINTCTKSAYQRAAVSVPIEVKPFAYTGPTQTLCCTDPIIKDIRCHSHCGHRVCYFTISQEICVEVPVHFGAKAEVGEAWIDCHEASTHPCVDC